MIKKEALANKEYAYVYASPSMVFTGHTFVPTVNFNVNSNQDEIRAATEKVVAEDRDHDSKATLFLMSQLRQLDFKRQQIGTLPALTLNVGK